MGLEKVIPDMRALRGLHAPARPLGHRTARDHLRVALPGPHRARRSTSSWWTTAAQVAGRRGTPQHAQSTCAAARLPNTCPSTGAREVTLLLFHSRAAGHQPQHAPFAEGPPRQCLGLLAVLLLLRRYAPAKIDLGGADHKWRQQLDALHLADPRKKRPSKGMDAAMA